ncbi:Hsp33 family molecular chaperone HslO [Chloracidobacterium sp. MS 40/45]|jgi:molecular chaperone Hsp33|uniref:Hsp33 family molecular chaperone HslO n=1 Tax=Chloracidobacterium aggregatum TaxID=2851959 RepID=UPI001B8D53C5|nr:Hsp33 family molecular chaperone HslO [Chloracidobacterium aggregatum]QUV99126.1 Hsp33 family molecular chaperone HslO [Chloracidobacterium sp. MS 40/45]
MKRSSAPTPDRLLQAVAAGDTVRIVAATTTHLVQEACRRHKSWKTATVALGRTLTGAALLASALKTSERVTIHIEGRGPVGTITAEANAQGEVRGYVQHPQTDVPLRPDGKLNIGAAVGRGVLHVIREGGFEIGLMEAYRGSVPLVSGEIAEDLTYYLSNSEQVPSAMSLGVYMEAGDGVVGAAGGFLVQVLPDADEATLAHLERAVAAAPPVTQMVKAGATPEDLIRQALGELDWRPLLERPLKFACTCSLARTERLLVALGVEEMQSLLAEQGQAELTCHYCNAVYRLSADDLQRLIALETAG